MNKYTLTDEGRWRFRRIKLRGDTGMARMEGYEILDYLYEKGSGTVEEIAENTGLAQVQVINRISWFIHNRFVEKLAEL